MHRELEKKKKENIKRRKNQQKNGKRERQV